MEENRKETKRVGAFAAAIAAAVAVESATSAVMASIRAVGVVSSDLCVSRVLPTKKPRTPMPPPLWSLIDHAPKCIVDARENNDRIVKLIRSKLRGRNIPLRDFLRFMGMDRSNRVQFAQFYRGIRYCGARVSLRNSKRLFDNIEDAYIKGTVTRQCIRDTFFPNPRTPSPARAVGTSPTPSPWTRLKVTPVRVPETQTSRLDSPWTNLKSPRDEAVLASVRSTPHDPPRTNSRQSTRSSWTDSPWMTFRSPTKLSIHSSSAAQSTTCRPMRTSAKSSTRSPQLGEENASFSGDISVSSIDSEILNGFRRLRETASWSPSHSPCR